MDLCALPKLVCLRAGFVPAPRTARLALRAARGGELDLPKLDGPIVADLV